RQQDDEIVIVHVARDGAHEIARWEPTVPGQPRHDPAHFGPPPEGPLHRTPRARTPDEAAFLAIGSGAQQWLISAAAVGSARIRTKDDRRRRAGQDLRAWASRVCPGDRSRTGSICR